MFKCLETSDCRREATKDKTEENIINAQYRKNILFPTITSMYVDLNFTTGYVLFHAMLVYRPYSPSDPSQHLAVTFFLSHGVYRTPPYFLPLQLSIMQPWKRSALLASHSPKPLALHSTTTSFSPHDTLLPKFSTSLQT